MAWQLIFETSIFIILFWEVDYLTLYSFSVMRNNSKILELFLKYTPETNHTVTKNMFDKAKFSEGKVQ